MEACDTHCWHVFAGKIHFVELKEEHVLMNCCSCNSTREVHKDYMWEIRGIHKYENYSE